MLVDILLSIIILAVILPVIFFSIQILFSFRNCDEPSEKYNTIRPKIVVLVPAHNEEDLIEETLVSIAGQLQSGDQIIVIADNCDDSTAEISRKNGATVFERSDNKNRGKGFALAYGVKKLESNPPDVVVIIDADCIVGDNTIRQISNISYAEGRPVQANYIMEYKSKVLSLKQRIASFAWRIKNYARPLGLKNMGLPCQLMGTGMAFPYTRLQEVEIGTDNIVEDMQMGLDMAVIGASPIFSHDVKVTSNFPELKLAEVTQRRRWEHGHIGMIIDQFPSLLIKSVLKKDRVLFGLAMDLLIPPLTLLSLIIALLFGLSAIGHILFELELAFTLSVIMLALFFTSVVAAWMGYGRDVMPPRDILSLPVHILSKIPLYIKFLVGREKKWIRTKRD